MRVVFEKPKHATARKWQEVASLNYAFNALP